jgi:hypothetical protein
MNLFKNIFNGKENNNSASQMVEANQVSVSETKLSENPYENRENILEFKNIIKNAVEEQKAIKKVTRAPHANYNEVWPKQTAEIENRQWLFKAYTTYYILKHYLWVDESKMNEYIEKVISDAKRALEGSDSWSDKYIKDHFRSDVKSWVKTRIPEV